jgi:hypothetical protein
MEYLSKVMAIVRRAEAFGVQKLLDGTLLVGHVPQVAEDAWLHQIFAPLDERGLNEMNAALGRNIPKDLQEFYRHCNGFNLYTCSLAIYGLRQSYARTSRFTWQPFSIVTPNTLERPSDAKESFLFFGGYSFDGSLLYLDTDTGKVHRCFRSNSKSINQWNCFGDMLVTETIRIGLMFDDHGQQLNQAEPTTP